ncbi:MAG: siderophore-interacting protein [Pseudomonadota bacterium]
MSIVSGIEKAIGKATGRPGPRLLTVKEAYHLTPNMIRVIFSGPELESFPEGREGGNCKLMIPEPEEPKADFAKRLSDGPTPIRRTYTVRKYDAEKQELAIDFVAHGDNGPASSWAGRAKPGDFLGFVGPSLPKMRHFEADWYLLAADPSAIPVVAASLEAMPRDAKGMAIFEVNSEADRQKIDMPPGIETHWLIHPDPNQTSDAQEQLIRSIDWPDGRVQTCIAGEAGAIKGLREFLAEKPNLERQDIYISSYWKIGMVEDQHQKVKHLEG